MTPSMSWQMATSCQFGGEYCLFYVSAGNTYEWSYCSSNGGSASWNTELSLYDNATLTCLDYNDDYCGYSSHITWYSTFNGIVRVKTNQYSCLTNSNCATLVYRGGCSSCTGWYTAPSADYFSAYGGTSSFTVYASGVCYFNASASASWINNINYPGSGMVEYDVDPNPNCVARTGYIQISETCTGATVATVTIYQSPSGLCSNWNVVPAYVSYNESGGSGSFTVYAIGTCFFSWVDTISWINNLTSLGSGVVAYDVDINTNNTPRFGTIYIIETCDGDTTGTFTIQQSGSTVGMQEKSNEATVSLFLYPNPTSGEFTLDISGVIYKDASISITNLIGEIVYEQKSISKKQLINLSDVSNGLYIVTLTLDGEVIQRKLNVVK